MYGAIIWTLEAIAAAWVTVILFVAVFGFLLGICGLLGDMFRR